MSGAANRILVVLLVSAAMALGFQIVGSTNSRGYGLSKHQNLLRLSMQNSAPHFVQRVRKAAAAATLCFGLFAGNANAVVGDKVFNEVWKIVKDNYQDATYNGNDWEKIKVDYTSRLESGADERELTKKMLSLLGDKYTRLLDRKFYESLWKYDAIGVGLLFQSEPGKHMTVASNPIDGSSAKPIGFKKGDIVYSINGESTETMTAMQLLDMMSNDERSSVTIEYSSVDDNNSETPLKKTVTLKRSTQKAENPVSYYSQKLSDGKLAGYVRLTEFNAEAVKNLRIAVVDLRAQGIDELLLDLRGNTGGGFQFALNIGGMFMGDKEMVTALGKNNEKNVFRTSYPDGIIYDKPLVLLTDGLSASASEVLAGGLHDNCRAVLTGARTFGKGKIQAVFGLSGGEGLTMTVAQYVTPRGTIIQSKGLEPDIESPTLNAYVAMLAGPSLTKPDLEKVDFSQAEELVNTCKVATVTASK